MRAHLVKYICMDIILHLISYEVNNLSLIFDVGKSLVPRTGEIVSGDTIEVLDSGHSTTIVLADGMGSGLKANILSSLTAKMAIGLLKNGLPLDDVCGMLAQSLPTTCSNASVGYSTFTILQISSDGHADLVEYNNPESIIGTNSKVIDIPRETTTISGKLIGKCSFHMDENSWVVLISDGVTNAGVGDIWNHGWGQERVQTYLSRVVGRFDEPQGLCEDLCSVCQVLYSGKVTDDVSAAAIFAHKNTL